MSTDTSKYTLKKNETYGFMQITPTPTLEEISAFYAQEFYSSEYKKMNASTLEVQTEDQEYYNNSREDVYEAMMPYLPATGKTPTLLDIGCGWCQALVFFKNKGFDCYGFDPAPEAIEHGKKLGLQVKVAGLEKMDVFGKKFDVVTLFNVLEHVADPEKVVREIKEVCLNPGGLLIIDVPNEFNDFQVVGQKIHHLPEWWVSPPAHLNYFNGTTLRNLLNGSDYSVKEARASFPVEMFLLFGKKYVGDSVLGRQCHLERAQFEMNLRKNGKTEKLRAFYKALAGLDLGRQIFVIAKSGAA